MTRLAVLAPINLVLLLVAGPAWASEPIPPIGAGSSPGVQSTLATWTESARFGTPGWLESEFAYRASLNGFRNRDGQDLTLHTGDLLLGYPATETLEFRLGWHAFYVTEYDGFNDISSVGDPWISGKFALTRLPDLGRPQQLSLLGRIQPGIGQAPFSVPGVTFQALALWTVGFGSFEVDANAGLAFNTSNAPSYFSLPLGGRIVWFARDWLDVYGELVEILHFTDLRASETQIAGGCALRPVDAFDVSFTGGLGLSESLPAGFIQIALTFRTANFGQY